MMTTTQINTDVKYKIVPWEPDCVLMAKDYYWKSKWRKATAKKLESKGHTVIYVPGALKSINRVAEQWNLFMARVWSPYLKYTHTAAEAQQWRHLSVRIAKDVTLANAIFEGIDADLLGMTQTMASFHIATRSDAAWEKAQTKIEAIQAKYKNKRQQLLKDAIHNQFAIPAVLYPSVAAHMYKFLNEEDQKTVLSAVSPKEDCVFMGTNRAGNILLYSYESFSKDVTALHMLGNKVDNTIRQIGYSCSRSGGVYKDIPLWSKQIKRAIDELRNLPRGTSIAAHYTQQYRQFLSLNLHMEDVETQLNKEYALEVLNYMFNKIK